MTDYASDLLGGKPQQEPQPIQTAGTDYAASLLGGAPAAPLKPPADPNAEPDAPTWLGRRKQDILGKQDPRFADVGAYSGDNLKRLGAGMVTHDDAAYGDIIKGTLGDRLIRTFKDANGYDLIEYRGEGADADKAYRAYINKPGLDRFDVSRGLAATAPLALGGGAGGALLQGAGLGTRAAAQGGIAALTSLGQDAIASTQGSQQGYDLGRAGIFAAGGAAGEAVGAAVKPFMDKWTAAGFVKNGALTPEGEAAVKAAGLDPANVKGRIAEEFAKTYAKTGDKAASALKVHKASPM